MEKVRNPILILIKLVHCYSHDRHFSPILMRKFIVTIDSIFLYFVIHTPAQHKRLFPTKSLFWKQNTSTVIYLLTCMLPLLAMIFWRRIGIGRLLLSAHQLAFLSRGNFCASLASKHSYSLTQLFYVTISYISHFCRC